MGKKDKKKGKGAEKTIAKTEKKAVQKLKKELAAKGEEDIEKMISQFVEEDRKRLAVTEELVGPPSCRSGATLCVHPEKDQLLLFGGEYFNGQKVMMYHSSKCLQFQGLLPRTALQGYIGAIRQRLADLALIKIPS
ncbi:hypothetical protein V5799_011984 [Amblyomma americanum]|uniref:Uncharacterized protein n=1 Tax=Amblyomma americanum TaxID=6943 RepID=A0AAQ4EFB6_AMBAM